MQSLYKRIPQLKHNPQEPHRVRFYHLIYITKGSGRHFIDFNYHPFRVGSFIFVRDNQVHAFDFKRQVQGQIILFTQQFLDETSISIRMPFVTSNLLSLSSPVLSVKSGLKDSCTAILSELGRELESESCNNQIAQNLFSVLLLKLNRERPVSLYDSRLSELQTMKFNHFIRLIEQHFYHSRDASFYAQKLHMTYKTLNKICKRACNQTPKHLIDAYTILEAKRRLVIDNTQIGQLAYELGFQEETNFTKYFKRKTLLSPSQFKKKYTG